MKHRHALRSEETHHPRMVEESIETLTRIWHTQNLGLNWNCLFMTPLWLQAWLRTFSASGQAKIYSLRVEEQILGIAPLLVESEVAGLVGSPDLCDYLDFIVKTGEETSFFSGILEGLPKKGIRRLEIGPIREDSEFYRYLSDAGYRAGWEVGCQDVETSYEMPLPESWEKYLSLLTGKQRHEIRRKLRRLSGSVTYRLRTVQEPEALEGAFEQFLDLFHRSRSDKTDFLSIERLSFFQHLVQTMACAGMLKLYFLDVDNRPAGSALCFDDGNNLHLYNSGYDPYFSNLSPGWMCILLTIQDGIDQKRKTYNFLKGDEAYKKQMGGRPVRLKNCRMHWNPTRESELFSR